jgi:hypothetical protein
MGGNEHVSEIETGGKESEMDETRRVPRCLPEIWQCSLASSCT